MLWNRLFCPIDRLFPRRAVHGFGLRAVEGLIYSVFLQSRMHAWFYSPRILIWFLSFFSFSIFNSLGSELECSRTGEFCNPPHSVILTFWLWWCSSVTDLGNVCILCVMLQTVVCIPLMDGVVEFGTTDKVSFFFFYTRSYVYPFSSDLLFTSFPFTTPAGCWSQIQSMIIKNQIYCFPVFLFN